MGVSQAPVAKVQTLPAPQLPWVQTPASATAAPEHWPVVVLQVRPLGQSVLLVHLETQTLSTVLQMFPAVPAAPAHSASVEQLHTFTVPLTATSQFFASSVQSAPAEHVFTHVRDDG